MYTTAGKGYFLYHEAGKSRKQTGAKPTPEEVSFFAIKRLYLILSGGRIILY